MNLFFLAFLTLPPIMTFWSGKKSYIKIKTWRLLLSCLLAYLLFNIGIEYDYRISWKEYELCQSTYPDGEIQHHDYCGNPPSYDLAIIFYIFVGWIPTTAYVGFWEFCWRIHYRKEIRLQKLSFKNKLISNIVIVFFIILAPVVIAALVALTLNYRH